MGCFKLAWSKLCLGLNKVLASLMLTQKILSKSSKHTIFLFTVTLSFAHAAENSPQSVATAPDEIISPQYDTRKFISQINALEDKELAAEKLTIAIDSANLSVEQQQQLAYQLGIVRLQQGNFDLSIEAFTLAVKLAASSNQIQQVADAQKMLGVNHYYQGNYQEALSAYQAAITYYKVETTPIKHANLVNNIGLVYAAMQELNSAIAHYQIAEPIYLEFGSEQDKIDIRHNIAGLYIRSHRFDAAIELLEDVLKRTIAIESTQDIDRLYSDLGAAYRHSKQYALAQHYLEKAIETSVAHNKPYDTASQLHNLSEVYNDLGQPTKAIELAEKALALAKSQQHKGAHSGALHSLAQANYFLSNYPIAKTYLQQSNTIAKEMNYQGQIQDNRPLMALILSALESPDSALALMNTYRHELVLEENNALNRQFASFEATQLKQKLEQMQQQDLLNQLAMAKARQQRNFILIAVVLVLLSLFFVYLRNNERAQKRLLSAKVKQRTQELEILMEKLKTADQVKGQFLANMSHEIRTPLTAVIGQAEAIVNGDVSESYMLEEVEVIHENSVYLLDLINDILDLSKIEENKLEIDIRRFNLHQLIHDLEQMFFERTTAKGLAFEIIHQLPARSDVAIDHFRVKQILINLCSNAVKFTLAGKVTLRVELKAQEVVFNVTDTGIGLAPEQLEKIFQSFTQGDNSIARQFGGSGLGLSLCDKLAKAMNGTIEVASQAGKGSTFTLTIPCERYYDQLSISSIATSSHADIVPGSLAGQILLAEDHIDNRRLITRLLQRLGLEVLVAENGLEAIELYQAHQPKLILMDIQMPEVDGIEALKKLRELGCDAPIIAFTANAMIHEVERYLSIGFDGHLTKPINRQAFIETIAKYFPEQTNLEDADSALNNVDISDLSRAFVASLDQELNTIKTLTEQLSFKELQITIHRLAGAAQMFGFSQISTLAIAIETAIKQGDQQKSLPLIAQLNGQIEQVISSHQ